MTQTWPAGVKVATYSWGVALDSFGNPATSGSVTAKLVVEGAAFLKHLATGTPLTKQPSVLNAASGTFTLPLVDQDGFYSPDNTGFKFWSYEITVQYKFGNSIVTQVYMVQPVAGDDIGVIDIDNQPLLGAGIPAQLALGGILSIGGLKGPYITLEQLRALLAGTEIPTDPEEPTNPDLTIVKVSDNVYSFSGAAVVPTSDPHVFSLTDSRFVQTAPHEYSLTA